MRLTFDGEQYIPSGIRGLAHIELISDKLSSFAEMPLKNHANPRGRSRIEFSDSQRWRARRRFGGHANRFSVLKLIGISEMKNNASLTHGPSCE